MKRILYVFISIFAFCTALAQNHMVTLSHNGELKFFTDVQAFQSAYDAAVNGDTIFLSEGLFPLKDGKISIGKRLSVVGNGYDSHIVGDISFDLSNCPDSHMDAPLFDGVMLDNLYFYYDDRSMTNLGESEIRRCRIETLTNGAYAGTNVLYDKCYIGNANFYGSGSVVVKNSKLFSIVSCQGVLAVNCNIYKPQQIPGHAVSCIISHNYWSSYWTNSEIRKLEKCLLDFRVTLSNIILDGCYTSDNRVLDSNGECMIDLAVYNCYGADGTVVGIYGGGSPYSQNPSLPSVDTSKSTVEYDSDSKKLKVSITVKAD